MTRFLERCRELVRPYYLRGIYFPFFNGRPVEFADCWRHPTQPLTPETLAGDKKGSAPAFLFLPMSDWHSRRQRSHHLASMLAEHGHDCYFLNPHLGRHYAAVYGLDSQPRAGTLGPRLKELHVRVPAEPVYHHRLLTAAETRRMADALAPLATVHGPALIQMVSFPTWGELALTLRERHGWPMIYDCHDLLQGFGNIAPEVVDAEAGLMDRADFVVFSSEYLRQAHSRTVSLRFNRVTLLRNAVDSGFVRLVEEAAARQPGATRKVAGYIGALEKWFDTEAVRDAAVANPDVLFRIVGRIEHDPVRSLAALPNVELVGEAPHERLPEILASFSVGLIPFIVNELTCAADPIKLYEYFSAGLPVVSARLPEVERYADLVYFADSTPDFAAQVSRAVAENDAMLRARRIELVRSETWDQRTAALLDIANSLLSRTR